MRDAKKKEKHLKNKVVCTHFPLFVQFHVTDSIFPNEVFNGRVRIGGGQRIQKRFRNRRSKINSSMDAIQDIRRLE